MAQGRSSSHIGSPNPKNLTFMQAIWLAVSNVFNEMRLDGMEARVVCWLHKLVDGMRSGMYGVGDTQAHNS